MVAFIKHHWNAIFGMRASGESSASSALFGSGVDVDGAGDQRAQLSRQYCYLETVGCHCLYLTVSRVAHAAGD
jgi:hypothetical protein